MALRFSLNAAWNGIQAMSEKLGTVLDTLVGEDEQYACNEKCHHSDGARCSDGSETGSPPRSHRTSIGNDQLYVSHVVQPDENLASIALKYGVDMVHLMSANRIFNQFGLQEGQVLRIASSNRSKSSEPVAKPLLASAKPSQLPVVTPTPGECIQGNSEVSVESASEGSDSGGEQTRRPRPTRKRAAQLCPSPPANTSPCTPCTCDTKYGSLRCDHSAERVGIIPVLFGSTRDKPSVLTGCRIQQIHASLPKRFSACECWHRLYSTLEDGISLHTLYRNCAGISGCIFVVMTSEGETFGAFCSGPLVVEPHYRGNGETLLFNWTPEFTVHRWSQVNDFFMLCAADYIAFGGGAHFGLFVDEDLRHGTTGSCETFNSPPLSKSEDFDIYAVEVWCLPTSRKPDGECYDSNWVDPLHPVKPVIHPIILGPPTGEVTIRLTDPTLLPTTDATSSPAEAVTPAGKECLVHGCAAPPPRMMELMHDDYCAHGVLSQLGQPAQPATDVKVVSGARSKRSKGDHDGASSSSSTVPSTVSGPPSTAEFGDISDDGSDLVVL